MYSGNHQKHIGNQMRYSWAAPQDLANRWKSDDLRGRRVGVPKTINHEGHSGTRRKTCMVLQLSCDFPLGKGAADFPVVAEGIDYSADAPVVLLSYGIDFFGAGFYCASKNGIRVGDRQNDSNRDAA